MNHDEFELNKDLLKEIASKKKELRDTISMTKNDQMTREHAANNTRPAYEIYELWWLSKITKLSFHITSNNASFDLMASTNLSPTSYCVS